MLQKGYWHSKHVLCCLRSPNSSCLHTMAENSCNCFSVLHFWQVNFLLFHAGSSITLHRAHRADSPRPCASSKSDSRKCNSLHVFCSCSLLQPVPMQRYFVGSTAARPFPETSPVHLLHWMGFVSSSIRQRCIISSEKSRFFLSVSHVSQ